MSTTDKKEYIRNDTKLSSELEARYFPDVVGLNIKYSESPVYLKVLMLIADCIPGINHNLVDLIACYLSSWVRCDTIQRYLLQTSSPFDIPAVSDNVTTIVIHHEYYYCRDYTYRLREVRLYPKIRKSLVITRKTINFTVDAICHCVRSLSDTILNFIKYDVSFRMRGNKLYIGVYQAFEEAYQR